MDPDPITTAAADSSPPEPENPYLKGWRLKNLMGALLMGMLLIGLDINIVATVNEIHPTRT
ncbi:predicted protein [Uncinocarpus reesii 1704]|uniref:Uncharacterized protein n=1 Tax=Uncinocarpus reesii (strain UAMH 1704) TaxID=336963 RepID=C4JV79_UNCRE|nr:uncharacterized protein UREG_06471 [Uncinocarpus reesii 1704]EEP81606.1 predicted protein [Uncinocarpus reesii 1704]